MIRRLLILSILCSTGCAARTAAVRPMAALQRAPLYTFNEQEIDAYLRQLSGDQPDTLARLTHLARKSLGQPYRPFLLGEFPFELTDPDPLYCLSASDCVTLVEQSYALALSSDWSGFFKTLQRIRYMNGVIGYETRNHFAEADWNPNNAWLFEEVTDRLAPAASEPIQTRVDRAAFLARAGVRCSDPPQVVSGRFIPVARLSSVAAGLRDGDIVELVKGDGQWQYVSHMGLVFHDREGRVTLLHSGKPAVLEEPLAGYLERHPAITGLRFLRLRTTGDVASGSGLE